MSDPRQAGTAAVTGAGGYIGGIVGTALAADGFQVIRLVRRPEAGSSDRLYDLRRDLDASLLEGVDALIHCAAVSDYRSAGMDHMSIQASDSVHRQIIGYVHAAAGGGGALRSVAARGATTRTAKAAVVHHGGRAKAHRQG